MDSTCEWEADPSNLVDLVYASTLDPNRYDELMHRWKVHLDAAVADGNIASAGVNIIPDGTEIERHFHRAFTILERLGRPDEESPSLDALVKGEERPAMLVDRAGRILAVNDRAFELLNVSVGGTICELSLEASGIRNIRQALTLMDDAPAGRLLTLTRVQLPHDGSTPIVALSRARSDDRTEPVALLSIADISWSDRIGEMLKDVFGLTIAECDIARGVIAGQSAEQIALARNRSEQTVRTQIKSLLRKLELRNQAELIRMIAALMLVDAAAEVPAHPPEPQQRSFTAIVRDAGRLLDVMTIGPDAGRPVIFIHGMMDGRELTEEMQEGLAARNIRLICPARPNFGASGPDGPPAGAAARFAGDVAAILDHFGIPSCPLMGFGAGAVFTFAAAARLGGRVCHVVNVSGGVPIIDTAQFATMTPRQQIIARTARFAPRLLPLILRAGIALLDSGGDRAFLDALYRSAPVDHAIALRPDIFRLLRNGYRFTVAQGHRAFEIDAHHVVLDWSDEVRASDQPVTLVHGRHDPVVDVATVRDFVQRLDGRARLIELPDQGQLLLHSCPQAVIEALDDALATAPNRPGAHA